jgi:hypothetical protein
MPNSPVYELHGRCKGVGLSSAFFTPDQLDDQGMSGEEKLLIIRIDDDNPADVPIGLIWADRVRLTLQKQPTVTD